MVCCAIAPGCGRPTCKLCTVTAKLPQPTFKNRAGLADQDTAFGTMPSDDAPPALPPQAPRKVVSKKAKTGSLL